ncbi:hypothetical protein ACFVHR_23295 [Streptomyces sp. NPDC127168]|uniref:hypothetical protein n=1 Tax=unclassified Streptomyces TaxID=2593676 RepID=UPI00363699B7
MRIRAKTAAVVTMGLATVLLAAAPSSAVGTSWTRSCGTTYYAVLKAYPTYHIAETSKGPNGSCAGHAWVRIKVDGEWSAWRSDSKVARAVEDWSTIQVSQHKGCGDCDVKSLYP